MDLDVAFLPTTLPDAGRRCGAGTTSGGLIELAPPELLLNELIVRAEHE